MLLKLALAYDRLIVQFSKLAAWAVLLAALISSGNAFVRYGFVCCHSDAGRARRTQTQRTCQG